MNESQGQPDQFEGISLIIIIFKNEVNPLTNNKVIQKHNKNKQKVKYLTLNVNLSRSFMNEGQCSSGQLEGISLKLSKYEDNPLKNKS